MLDISATLAKRLKAGDLRSLLEGVRRSESDMSHREYMVSSLEHIYFNPNKRLVELSRYCRYSKSIPLHPPTPSGCCECELRCVLDEHKIYRHCTSRNHTCNNFESGEIERSF